MQQLGLREKVEFDSGGSRIAAWHYPSSSGACVVIARAGVPVVRLVPVVRQGARILGQWRGKVRMSEDFDAPLPADMLDDWER